ncbi:tetratricopeptide repeat protein [Flavobacterium amniphilum]|uniref:tetratricopeptide repeat-containing sensor histidine kinase n=1 Tax=Flavobacterium amniphilum TaxID=1834035 RepID=UPI002029D76C|nr:tetratricopeptide repeat protein [Flavobacterium amniphilum]MCL9805458.1 tetratricopeptide repeat protein [Flavobacterium amniphilum]
MYVNNTEAKKYAGKVLQLAKKLQYERAIAAGTNDMALILLSEGHANKAYQMLRGNLIYYRKVQNFTGLGTNYLNIGLVHGTQNELDKAIGSFKRALYYYKKGNANNNKLAACYSMLGNAYSYLNDEKQSIKNYRKALQLEDDPEDLLSMQNNLGKAYADFKKYDSALYFFQKAVIENKKIKSSYNEMISSHYIGDLYLKMQQPDQAIQYLKKGLGLAQQEKNLDDEMLINKKLAEAYTLKGDYKSALQFHREYASLKDTLQTKSNTAEVKKIETKFELERQDAKLTLLENQKKLNEAELKKSNLILLMGSVVLLLFIALTWYWYRQHKTKALLNQQQEVQFKTTLQLKETESNLEGQLLERKRLSQELHDGLGATLAGIKLSAIAHFTEKEEGQQQLIASLDDACHEVRRMSHNLMPPAFSELPFAQITEELIRKHSGHPHTQLHLEIHGREALDCMNTNQKTQTYRILQEIINNAFKHAQCSHLSLFINSFDDHVNIMAEDNGIGFDSNQQQEGIGLHNIRERIKELQTNLTIDSSPGNGTVIQFNIPLHQ